MSDSWHPGRRGKLRGLVEAAHLPWAVGGIKE